MDIENTVPVLYCPKDSGYDFESESVLCFVSDLDTAEAITDEGASPEFLGEHEMMCSIPVNVLQLMPYFLKEKNLINDFIKWNNAKIKNPPEYWSGEISQVFIKNENKAEDNQNITYDDEFINLAKYELDEEVYYDPHEY